MVQLLLYYRTGLAKSRTEAAEKGTHMLQAYLLPDEKLPLSTAMLSNVVLALVLWNLALRLALLFGRWAITAAL